MSGNNFEIDIELIKGALFDKDIIIQQQLRMIRELSQQNNMLKQEIDQKTKLLETTKES